MDDLAWLRLQLEWGADEALEERPVDRRAALEPPLAALAVPSSSRSAAPLTGLGAVQHAQELAAAAATPEALQAALAGFTGCALRATATNLVFRDGDPAATTVLIADVPGAAEDRAGLPFAGPAAALLDRMFTSAGLDRSHMLSLSLLPWRPPGDRKPADAEVVACLPFLLRHLALVRPKRAILWGALTARILLGEGRRARGVWHKLTLPDIAEPVPALAMPSPSHIIATWGAKRDTWADMLRLRRALDGDRNDHV